MPRKENEFLMLSVTLTQEEKSKLGVELSTAYRRMNQAKADGEASASALKAEMKNAKALADELSDKLQTGRGSRQVECTIFYDWEDGIKTWRRNDTWEEVKKEKITDSEKQEELDFQAKTKAEAEANGVQQEAELPPAEPAEQPKPEEKPAQ